MFDLCDFPAEQIKKKANARTLTNLDDSKLQSLKFPSCRVHLCSDVADLRLSPRCEKRWSQRLATSIVTEITSITIVTEDTGSSEVFWPPLGKNHQRDHLPMSSWILDSRGLGSCAHCELARATDGWLVAWQGARGTIAQQDSRHSASNWFSSCCKLVSILPNPSTPSYKEPIPGSEQPFLETYFFLHFLPRLSGNDRSRVISMANFGPTASNLRYDF